MLANTVARLIAKLNRSIPEVDERDSVFFDQTCVKCGTEFDVPADFVFDRRKAYYCDACRRRHERGEYL
jgi:hypothetical protein